MRLEKHINEGIAKISPLLKSVIGKRWDAITQEEADGLVSVLAKIGDKDTKFSLAPAMGSASKFVGNNYVTITKSDKDYSTVSKDTEKALDKDGWKVVASQKGDSNTWWIYFARK